MDQRVEGGDINLLHVDPQVTKIILALVEELGWPIRVKVENEYFLSLR